MFKLGTFVAVLLLAGVAGSAVANADIGGSVVNGVIVIQGDDGANTIAYTEGGNGDAGTNLHFGSEIVGSRAA